MTTSLPTNNLNNNTSLNLAGLSTSDLKTTQSVLSQSNEMLFPQAKL